MNKIKKNLDNQAIGLLPLILFMFLDNFFPYMPSFVMANVFFLFCFFLYWRLRKHHIYQFMLLPTIFTFMAYAVFFLFLRVQPMLFRHSPLVVEVLLVVILVVFGFSRVHVLRGVRQSSRPAYQRLFLLTTLNEAFFIGQLAQVFYTLHLFCVLLYSVMPSDLHQNLVAERLLYRELPWLIGLLIIFYEQVRVFWVQGSLEKEMWLPVLNDEEKVVGCIARSISRALPKKYYHPVIRVAVVYNGMLYLTKRSSRDFVSPNSLDHPLRSYLLFKRSYTSMLRALMGTLADDRTIEPHCLVRYTFENERVKHLVHLYTIRLANERQLAELAQERGKLWTVKQIEENLGKSVFSSYFEKEFAYLQNTVLLAEKYGVEEGR